jgi:branched-chain amino acid transport system ATP-binding protein
MTTTPTRADPRGTEPATDHRALLQVSDLRAGYGAAAVLHGIDLEVAAGEIVVVLGANGAGKTTLLRALAGLIPHTGTITVDGHRVTGARPDLMLARGIGLVPQGRGTLTDLTVRDNLRVGAITRNDKSGIADDIERWFGVFPRLKARQTQVAGTLSGGEQQMLAIARAMMSRPRLLLCDEVSLGLAPVVVQEVFRVLQELNSESGTALLLVEQNAALALDIASRAYLLEVGLVISSGSTDLLRDNDSIRKAYLGY